MTALKLQEVSHNTTRPIMADSTLHTQILIMQYITKFSRNIIHVHLF